MFEGKYTISYKKDSKTITKSFYFRNKKYDFACTICGRDLTITDENFSIVFPNSKIYRENPEVLEYFNDALKKAQFNTCYRHAHFFSQCFVESAGFNASAEGSKYGIDNLLETFNRNANIDGPKDHWYKQTFWDDKDYLNYVLMRVYETVAIGEQGTKIPKSNGYRISDTVRVVVAYDNMPKKGTYKSVSFTKDKQKINKQNVMNVAYANKLGNGDSKSGDGYRYRGRGAIQITGKSVYYGVGSKCNELFGTNYDFTSNPDIVTEPITTVQSAVAYFIWKGKDIGKNILEIMDKDNSFNVTKVVNSAGLEKETRNRKYKDFLSSIYFDCKPKK